MSVAAANSALQRARETISRTHGQPPDLRIVNERDMNIARRYANAWERRDLDAFLAALAEDAIFSMPPWRTWFRGRDVIVRFFDHAWRHYPSCSGEAFRLIPLVASGQPGFACYFQQGERCSAHSLHVLRIRDDVVVQVTCYVRPLATRLFDAFGLAGDLTLNGDGLRSADDAHREWSQPRRSTIGRETGG
jgi:RNA polymerase sigma-70 factor (ECF subfamily)